MSGEVKEFRPGILQEIGQEANEVVVEILESLLESAKSGEIVSIAGVALMANNGDLMTIRGNTLHSVYSLIGGLQGLSSEILFDLNMAKLHFQDDD